MPKLKRKLFWRLVAAGALLATITASPALAVRGSWVAFTGLADCAPSVSDTSAVVYTGAAGGLGLWFQADCDSTLLTLQGSQDQTYWTNIYQVQLNGTDETIAVQNYGRLSLLSKTSATAVEREVIAPAYIRLITNNNDTTGADTLEVVTAYVWIEAP